MLRIRYTMSMTPPTPPPPPPPSCILVKRVTGTENLKRRICPFMKLQIWRFNTRKILKKLYFWPFRFTYIKSVIANVNSNATEEDNSDNVFLNLFSSTGWWRYKWTAYSSVFCSQVDDIHVYICWNNSTLCDYGCRCRLKYVYFFTVDVDSGA